MSRVGQRFISCRIKWISYYGNHCSKLLPKIMQKEVDFFTIGSRVTKVWWVPKESKIVLVIIVLIWQSSVESVEFPIRGWWIAPGDNRDCCRAIAIQMQHAFHQSHTVHAVISLSVKRRSNSINSTYWNRDSLFLDEKQPKSNKNKLVTIITSIRILGWWKISV